MLTHPMRTVLLAGSAGALLALAGCAVYPAASYPYYGAPGYAPGYAVVAPTAPPPLIGEAITVAPGPDYFWIGGYWSWTGGRHAWTPGHWERPRPGYRWAPRTWQHGGDGWQQRGGQWERR